MKEITLLLFERLGILLVIAFILTRIPLFRRLIDRELNIQTSIYLSFLFGLFGIAGTYSGIVIHDLEPVSSFWIPSLANNETIAHAGLVGVVIGGLLGGPWVGLGAGLVAGVHLFYLGGMTPVAGLLSAPLTGFIAGWIARFYSMERVISPSKSLFIGMFSQSCIWASS